MAKLTVDYSNIVKQLKPIHGTGQPPLMGVNCDKFRYLKEAHVPYSRLHDVGGWFGGNLFVDIPNVFRDFNADENDPANYDFTFTDILLKGLADHDVKPIYRLGVTIENFFEIKVYRTNPPADFAKWARICEHVIRHYNEGWADGFHYGIEYWEIWNEPEVGLPPNNGMWTGTMEDYLNMYEITAKHLKACFGDQIKIGGYACSGLYGLFGNPEKYGVPSPKLEGKRYNSAQEDYRIEFFYSFLDRIEKNNVPWDFFTWHSYMNIDHTGMAADFFARELEKRGFGDVEIHLNEWNPTFAPEDRGTAHAASNYAATLLMMQDKKMDVMNFYDSNLSIGNYGGLFNPLTLTPFITYYPFFAFGEMYYELKNQAFVNMEGEKLYAVAATDDGTRKALMISNPSPNAIEVETNLGASFDVYVVDTDKYLEKEDIPSDKFTIAPKQVLYIKNF